MTGSSILLDTNIISALLKGDVSIANSIDQSIEVYIPVVVMGELYYGAKYSTQIEKNIKSIGKLIESYTILNIDIETASIYGTMKSMLRKRGTPIPENDIWIAALSKQYNLALITRDKHFTNIENISYT